MTGKESLAVIGGGSWATALVKVLLKNNGKLYWWVKEEEIIGHLKAYGQNPLYLSTVNLDASKIEISNNIKEIVNAADAILLCYPAPFLHEALKTLNPNDPKNKKIISAIKGIVPEANLTVSEYLNKTFDVPFHDIAVISGPSHSEEVAAEKLTYLTIASANEDLVDYTSSKLNCRFIETRKSEDLLGIEFAGILKNIYAIGAGIAYGLGYGDNFLSVYIANVVKEMEVFLNSLNHYKRDISASVYLGDLLVTCYSNFSRNRFFGNMIGKGYSVKYAQAEMKMIAEGYYALKSVKKKISNQDIDLPIISTIYKIIYENLPANNAFIDLKTSFN